MIGHLDDWIAETSDSISARLEGAREAQRQTRFTLGMMAVISMMMLICRTTHIYLSTASGFCPGRCKEILPSCPLIELKLLQTSSQTKQFRIGPRREMRQSNFWVFACQWMTCPCWVLSRSLFFLCGCCSSLDAKITPSDPCSVIPTLVVAMMSLIGILQCRNGKSRTRTGSGG